MSKFRKYCYLSCNGGKMPRKILKAAKWHPCLHLNLVFWLLPKMTHSQSALCVILLLWTPISLSGHVIKVCELLPGLATFHWRWAASRRRRRSASWPRAFCSPRSRCSGCWATPWPCTCCWSHPSREFSRLCSHRSHHLTLFFSCRPSSLLVSYALQLVMWKGPFKFRSLNVWVLKISSTNYVL